VPEKNPTADLETVFREQLRGFFLSPQEVSRHFEQADEEIGSREAVLASLQAEQAKLTIEMDKIMSLFLADQLPKEAVGERYRPLDERRGKVRDEIPRLLGELDFLKISLASRDELVREAQDLYGRWADLTADEKRRIVEQIVNRITIGEGDVAIDLCFRPSRELMAERGHNVSVPLRASRRQEPRHARRGDLRGKPHLLPRPSPGGVRDGHPRVGRRARLRAQPPERGPGAFPEDIDITRRSAPSASSWASASSTTWSSATGPMFRSSTAAGSRSGRDIVRGPRDGALAAGTAIRAGRRAVGAGGGDASRKVNGHDPRARGDHRSPLRKPATVLLARGRYWNVLREHVHRGPRHIVHLVLRDRDRHEAGVERDDERHDQQRDHQRPGRRLGSGPDAGRRAAAAAPEGRFFALTSPEISSGSSPATSSVKSIAPWTCRRRRPCR